MATYALYGDPKRESGNMQVVVNACIIHVLLDLLS